MPFHPISGYHIVVVAGIAVFIVHCALALVLAIGLRHPIKNWAALDALLAATFYLMLSGGCETAFVLDDSHRAGGGPLVNHRDIQNRADPHRWDTGSLDFLGGGRRGGFNYGRAEPPRSV
jgi:hypothetical protein